MEGAPRSEMFDDVYFSAHDGPGETAHVFFDGNNLPAAWQGRDRFTIAETGFGTGLNFLLAWELFDRTAPPGAFLDFISVEKFPLTAADIRKGLSPWAARLEPYLSKMLDQYPIRVPGFHRMVFDQRVALTLIFDDANDALEQVVGDVDAWFLDGFTPSKNPDMWTDKVLGAMAALSHAGTTFATFTAAGFVKRGLQSAGFTVEKKRGFGPKRDMLAGVFQGEGNRPPIKSRQSGAVTIYGAGLAGCAAAYVLRGYGFDPVLYDPQGIASGASGNDIGIINPRLSSFRTPESNFYTAGYAQTIRAFPFLKAVEYGPCGSLHLITDAERAKKFTRAAENWGWHSDHMRLVEAGEASEIAGVSVSHAALFLPGGAHVSPKALCAAYAKDIPVINREADMLKGAPVIFASGADIVTRFPDMPLHTVRGQVTFAKANAESQKMRANICYGGYIAPVVGGLHAVGATFQKWLHNSALRGEDDVDNLAKLAAVLPALGNLEIAGSRASLRVASKDRFPVAGAVPGGYISAAHGSHGLLSSLLCAHILADHIRGGPCTIGKASLETLSPARFWKD